MNEFNPGPGWQKHPSVPNDDERNYLFDAAADVYWVREDPLPTKPGYYVDAYGHAWRLDADGEWDDTYGNPPSPGSVDPKPPLERYEMRRETAKALVTDLIRLLDYAWKPGQERLLNYDLQKSILDTVRLKYEVNQ